MIGTGGVVMKRRKFIGLVGGAAAWPVVARAQQVAKVARIGWMSRGNATANDPNMNAFRQGMRELGYVEGQSFLLEPRYADGKIELMPDQAAELERVGVDVIIAGPFDALLAAKQRTSRVPIIMTPAADPVVTGIVERLDHPGGNITGITEMMPELTPQRLKLLTQIVPNISRVAIMWRPGTLSPSVFDQMLNDTQAAARSIGVQIQIVEAAKVDDFDSCHSKFEGDVLAFNEAGFGQAIAKCSEVVPECLKIPAIKKADHRHLLRPRRERPCRRPPD
jgi:putative tryptophan/tyrosine transport system substrate-binding protein